MKHGLTRLAFLAFALVLLLLPAFSAGVLFSKEGNDGKGADEPNASEELAKQETEFNRLMRAEEERVKKLSKMRKDIEAQIEEFDKRAGELVRNFNDAAEGDREAARKALENCKKEVRQYLASQCDALKRLNSLLNFEEASKNLPEAGNWRCKLALGDVNGDGYLDIAAAGKFLPKPYALDVWLYDGKGGWIHSKSGLPQSGCGGSCVFADVNKDKKLDLVFAPHGGAVVIFLGDGAGNWKKKEGAVDKLMTPPKPKGGQVLVGGFEDCAVGDINNDGNLDIIHFGYMMPGCGIYFGDGKGNCKLQPRNGAPDTTGADRCLLVDLNNDGALDILRSTHGAETEPREKLSQVYLGDGKGNWRPSAWGLKQVATDGMIQGVAAGDVNNDGNMDIAFAGSQPRFVKGNKSLLVFLGNGAGLWRQSTMGIGVAVYKEPAFADFDGDGNLDLAVVGASPSCITVYRGDGKGAWAVQRDIGIQVLKMQGQSLKTGDVDGDGFPDIVASFRGGRWNVMAKAKRPANVGEGGVKCWLNRPIGVGLERRIKEIIQNIDKTLRQG